MIPQKESNETWTEFANRLTIAETGQLTNKHIKAVELMIKLECLNKL